MAKARSLVGLDVYATKIVAAVLDADTGELGMFVLNGENAGAAALCAGLPRPGRAASAPGPTGYTLARELAKRLIGMCGRGAVEDPALDRRKGQERSPRR